MSHAENHHYRDYPGELASSGVEAFVRSQIASPPARVLEVGCGNGELALALVAAGWQVVAVDPRAPDGKPFVRTSVEKLDASDFEPFDAAVAVLSLHHAGALGNVLDTVRALLKPGGVFLVDEFRKDRLADRDTAAFYYYQRLALHHAGRRMDDGHSPMEGSFEDWFSRTSERVGVHREDALLEALEERFTTRSLTYGPYLFRQGLGADVEPLERKLIAEGGIQPTGLRWVGVR